MARTAVTVTSLTAEAANAFVLSSVGVAIDATNSHVIDPGTADPRELLLLVVNTTNATKVATVKAGVNPPAVRKGAGDISVSLTDGSTTNTHALVPLTGSRLVQADGTINVDIAAGMTGRIACFRVPRSA